MRLQWSFTLVVTAALATARSTVAEEILIEDFTDPKHEWYSLNDPVMGGESTGTVQIDQENGYGLFDGKVVDVPKLRAPGFITMASGGGSSYPDVSSCTSLKLTLLATETYEGYRVSFGTVHVPGGHHAYGYKANFDAPVSDTLADVIIPFTDFSAKWDDKTGNQIVTCQQEPEYCPDEEALSDLETMSIWGEGVGGVVHLKIRSISAVGCTATTSSSSGDETTPAQTASDETNTQEETPVDLELESVVEEDEILIESFADPSLTWTSMNDPVMGGESTGTFTVKDQIGNFDGKVVNVPFLHAPGFIKIDGKGNTFPDVSTCKSLKLTLMATEQYTGYRVSFGMKKPPHSFPYIHGFKAKFDAPMGSFGDVIIPFDEFSDKWDPATGDQIVTCKDNSKFCPDEETLTDMKEISIWGEGVAGNVHLKIQSISAVGCSSGGGGDGTTAGAAAVVVGVSDESLAMREAFFVRAKDGSIPLMGGLQVCVVLIVVAVVALVGVALWKRRRVSYDEISQVPESIVV